MAHPDRAYLSILQWPDGAEAQWCADALAAATGMDAYTARQAVRRGAPQVVCVLPVREAQRALESLYTAGITAMAPDRAAMRAMPDPVRAKRLLPALGAPKPMF